MKDQVVFPRISQFSWLRKGSVKYPEQSKGGGGQKQRVGGAEGWDLSFGSNGQQWEEYKK